MHLLYTTGHNLHQLPEGLSWPLIVGGAYGAVRLLRDVVEGSIRFYRRDRQMSELVARLEELRRAEDLKASDD